MDAPKTPNEPMLDSSGLVLTPSWILYFTQQAEFIAQQPTVLTVPAATTASIVAAQTSGTNAGTAAAAAQATANATNAYLASVPPQWLVGDIRLTMLTLSTDWLVCDGSNSNTSDYPSLSALLRPGQVGQPSGTFKRPTNPAYSDLSSGSTAIMQNWIRGR